MPVRFVCAPPTPWMARGFFLGVSLQIGWQEIGKRGREGIGEIPGVAWRVIHRGILDRLVKQELDKMGRLRQLWDH